MKIGELASLGGVNVQTIRFYERQGLLPEPPRRESGYRIYAPEDLHRLRFIRQSKILGFSLNEIATILRMREGGRCPCGKVISLAERHLQNVEDQIRRMQNFRRELTKALKQWKRSGARQVSAGALCVLIERAMRSASEVQRIS